MQLLARRAKNRRALIEIYTGAQKINSNVGNEVGENNLNPRSAQLIEERKRRGFSQVKRSRTERLACENSQCSSKMKANYVAKMKGVVRAVYREINGITREKSII